MNPAARPAPRRRAFTSSTFPPAARATIRLRLSQRNVADAKPFADFDAIFAQRIAEADEFYAELQHGIDRRRRAPRAAAGVRRHDLEQAVLSTTTCRSGSTAIPAQPPPPAERKHGRNREWTHLNNADIISMPDKWEYPWYAAWDLAFHCIPLALVDPEFAKQQLVLLTREWYMHPNGQMPAYEWAFGDVNPPVHAWATWRVFQIDRKQRRATNGRSGDLAFLERVFHKLMLNFTWWVNRKDAQGRNIFQGGFLGLDNIGVFDRSAPLPTGGFIDQADGTSWMAMYCLNLMRIALELAQHNQVYEDIATKFFEHFLHIADAMNDVGRATGLGLWDDAGQILTTTCCSLPDGKTMPLKVRSMVGLIPLFAVETLEPELLEKLPDFAARMEWFLNHRPDLAKLVSRWQEHGAGERQLLSLLRGHRMKCLLRRMLDETEFLSDYGVRALSKIHERSRIVFERGGARSRSALLAGRIRLRAVRRQLQLARPDLVAGQLSAHRVAAEVPPLLRRRFQDRMPDRLREIHHHQRGGRRTGAPARADCSCKATDGQRPVFEVPSASSQHDPHFRDYVLFHEYFHGDTGRGVGASHQTGWTGLVAKLLQPRAPVVWKGEKTVRRSGKQNERQGFEINNYPERTLTPALSHPMGEGGSFHATGDGKINFDYNSKQIKNRP